MTVFRLPDLGEGLVEASVVRWLVEPGDTVALNQPLAEVETAKAIVEIPSPFADVVAQLHCAVGEAIEVGAPLVTFGSPVSSSDPGSPESAATESASATPGSAEAARADAPEPTLVGYGAAARASGRPARRPRATSPTHPERPARIPAVAIPPEAASSHAIVPPRSAPSDPAVRPHRPRAAPPVRAYARRCGVDLEALSHSLGGRVITREDVDQRVRTTDSPDAAPAMADASAPTRVPVTGVRKATAEAMVQSAFTAPHVTVFHTIDVTETMEFIGALRSDRMYAEHRIGLLAVAAKAVCLALRAVPEVNARWDGEHGEIIRFGAVNLGIAAATERGLLVPIIHGAEQLSLVGLADALLELTAAARASTTPPRALRGGTFSITNIGVFGVDTGTPILPPGQAGILALGAVRRQPWEHQGEIALREVLTLSLSFDHRVIDGAEGSRLLKLVADLLESPARAMLWA